MCWNANVSLNTFLFSAGILALIVYNNAYTQYTIPLFKDRWAIAFMASFAVIQLIEYFIWRHLEYPVANHTFSILATILLVLQPVLSLMLLSSNLWLRNRLIAAYLLMAVPYTLYKLSTQHVHCVRSEKGHLRWKFLDTNALVWIVWLFFFLFSFLYEKRWMGLVFGLCALVICYVNYRNDHTMWSMWCWSVNGILFLFSFYLIFVLPFVEYRQVC